MKLKVNKKGCGRPEFLNSNEAGLTYKTVFPMNRHLRCSQPLHTQQQQQQQQQEPEQQQKCFYLLSFQNFLNFASPLHRDHHHRRRRCCYSRRRRRCCCYSRRLERIINLQTFSVILLIYLLTIQSVAYLRYLRLMNHRVR